MSRRLRERTSLQLAGLSREQRLALLNGHIRAPGKVPPKGEPLLREAPHAYGGETGG